ncbi:M20 family metallopeptidase [Rhodocaloribacter litoris]|uniref:M20 family metallopeptidase n=1 Tax=Rhodocaloribacter litoris TaxID=2558931 RepID=UPI00141DF56E|nr:M20 family metallopeptidase [Rhodocaloribacter litoris]QXD15503.1 M20 family metallopeptidase [Rhodocaloribacter litoris]
MPSAPSLSPVAEQLLAYLHDRRAPFIDFLQTLVRTESPSFEPARTRAVLDLLAEAFGALAFDVTHLPGRRTGGQLYARPRRRARGTGAQLLLGHADTVWPAGTLDEMPCTLKDGRLYGPGVFDMKAGLAMMVFALRALRDLDRQPALTPLVFVNTDEEIDSIESHRRIERLARVVDRVLVLEPALGPSGKIKTARKGTGEFEIIIHGRAAHAGLAPEEGRSAILELSYVIQQLFALNDPASGVTVNVGTVAGGLRTNVVAPECRLTVDVRVPSRADAERIERRIRGLKPTTPDVTLEIRGGFHRPPLERTPRNRALWQQYQALARELGCTLEEATAGGGSDGNFTSRFTATLDGLGAVGDGAHARHEHIDVDRTLTRCALLARLLVEPPAGAR